VSKEEVEIEEQVVNQENEELENNIVDLSTLTASAGDSREVNPIVYIVILFLISFGGVFFTILIRSKMRRKNEEDIDNLNPNDINIIE
jgi:hypothetical protein